MIKLRQYGSVIYITFGTGRMQKLKYHSKSVASQHRKMLINKLNNIGVEVRDKSRNRSQKNSMGKRKFTTPKPLLTRPKPSSKGVVR